MWSENSCPGKLFQKIVVSATILLLDVLIICHLYKQIDFHDTGRGSRVPSMTDYFGFTMSSLNEFGSVFANPCKGEKSASTLMYRPFNSWANNSEVCYCLPNLSS